MLDRKTVAECFQRHVGKDSKDLIAAVMVELAEIESVLEDVKAWRAGTIQHEHERQAVEDEDRKLLLAIRARCRHWTRTYNRDASGGSDSFHKCDFCGKTF